jgi:transposase
LLLVARKQLLGRLLDVELSIRGILRGFGLKVGQVTRKTFEARIRELVTGHTMLDRIAEAMLSARATLQAQYEKLHKAVLAFVREDAVCRRLSPVRLTPPQSVNRGRSRRYMPISAIRLKAGRSHGV